MSYLNELAEKWAKENAINEAEAFEYAIRSTNIKRNDLSQRKNGPVPPGSTRWTAGYGVFV